MADKRGSQSKSQTGEDATANPFAPPSVYEERYFVTRDSRDHSISAEPWMLNVPSTSDAKDMPGALEGANFGGQRPDRDEWAEHSIWDEPGTSSQLAGGHAVDRTTWFGEYQRRVRETSGSKTWLVTLIAAFFSGPVALGGVWLSGGLSDHWAVDSLMSPAIQELLKVAITLWIVERRPWLLEHPIQIWLCGLAAGLWYGGVEFLFARWVANALPLPTPALFLDILALLVQVACSLCAVTGCVAIRHTMLEEQRPPRVEVATAWISTAVLIHSLFNVFMILGR
jgi:hypothetical protein